MRPFLAAVQWALVAVGGYVTGDALASGEFAWGGAYAALTVALIGQLLIWIRSETQEPLVNQTFNTPGDVQIFPREAAGDE